jgi:hypothetical protein
VKADNTQHTERERKKMKREEEEEDELVPVGGYDTKTVVREGALEKQSPGMALKRWQTRHFTLTPSALFYRKKKSTGTNHPNLHLINPPSPFPSLATVWPMGRYTRVNVPQGTTTRLTTRPVSSQRPRWAPSSSATSRAVRPDSWRPAARGRPSVWCLI